MGRRLRVVLVGAAMAALVLGMAGGAGAQEDQTPDYCPGGTGDIVLDPGHGGSDWGAVYDPDGISLKEKDEVLKVAKILRGLLYADGYTVCMTRGGKFADDVTLANRERYTYANTTGAKLLVSIHMNGSSDPTKDYTTTLYGKPRKDLDLAKSVFNNLSLLPPAPQGTQGTIATRPPYQFASGILLKSNMPATIAETVFITNPDEATWLADLDAAPDRHQQIAEALEKGINAYYPTPQQ